MMHRVFWEPTTDPDIHHVVWSSDSPFQLAKPLPAHLAELQDNGMTLLDGADIEDGGPTEKASFPSGSYVSIGADGAPVAQSRPVTQAELDTQTRRIQRDIDRASARAKLLSLGLTEAELGAFLDVGGD